ncbi:16S rRNA (uracil(1498)-N(3))-methyltransferase [Candidatus Falkowbacteria bacterium]|nr:16S rRNA (uracil(1498)-N(3))-methyltransferase [Candidatus Falkowbacteria bacterium]
MKVHRFIGNFDFDKKISGITNKEIYNQIKNVLRLRAGEEIILGDGKGREARAEIMNFGKQSVGVNILKVEANQNEPEMKPILYVAILKKENFEFIAEKAVEAGVAEIIPVVTAKTIKTNLRMDRLEKIVREAAEQSGRGILPVVGKILKFGEALAHAEKNDSNLFFEINAPRFEQRKLAADFGKRVGIWIGPEGGWDEEEIKAVQEKNFQIVSLGKLTLRAETAAIVASYLIASAKN